MTTAPDDPLDPEVRKLLDELDNDPTHLEMLELVEQVAAAQVAELREVLGDPPELTAEEMLQIDAELEVLSPPDEPGGLGAGSWG